jgi:hypothetical protein
MKILAWHTSPKLFSLWILSIDTITGCALPLGNGFFIKENFGMKKTIGCKIVCTNPSACLANFTTDFS